MATEVRARRFSVSEFQRMGEAGILPPDERVELIEGEIIEMAPIGSRHAACVERLKDLLTARIIPTEVMLRVQNPVILTTGSQPQPDIAVVRYRGDHYEVRHPSADEVLLIAEVSDSTLAFDLEVKVGMYAESGVPHLWVIDLEHRVIEVFAGPSSSGYESHYSFHSGNLLPIGSLPAVLHVDDVLGQPSSDI